MEFVKKCTGCGNVLPVSEFPQALRYKYGVNSRCKKCVNKAAREYRLTHQIKSYYKSKQPQQTEENRIALNNFNVACGGYKIFILNHNKEGEFKYNALTTTDGYLFQTNQKDRFLNYLREIL